MTQEGNRRIFYRVVSIEEGENIQLSGELRQGQNSVEGKHLTGSMEEALRFAGKLYRDGEYRVVLVEVSEDISERFFLIGRLDNCGRAWFAELEDLKGCIISEVKP